MANTKNHAYLSDQQVLNFTIGLCETLSQESAAQAIAEILLKLLTPQELRMLVVRLQIQKMLFEFSTYAEIRKELHVSHGTISRVKLLLEQSGVRPMQPYKTEDPNMSYSDDSKRHVYKPKSSLTKGPLDKYSNAAWPMEFLGILIKALLDKQKPP